MTILFLYLLPAILVLLNIKVFKVISIFFAVCYLPGLSLFIFKKERLGLEDLILSFPVSLGISSLLTIGLLYPGIHVKYIACIIYLIVGLIILARFIVKYKRPLVNVEVRRNELIYLGIALLVTLFLSIPIISPRVAISAHGFHHSTIATEIINGIFPPENPGLGGTRLGYHWGYHAFIAVLSSFSDYPPLRVMSLLNVISLFFILCIAYNTAQFLGLKRGYIYLVPLALIGLMRADAVFFFMNRITGGTLKGLRYLPFYEGRPSEILQSWIWGGGAPWFDRRLLFLNKFYNANTMPVGIALCLSYFLILMIHLMRKDKDNSRSIYLIAYGSTLIGSSIIYPPLAIVSLLHAPVWAIFSFLQKKVGYKLKDLIELLIPYFLAVIIVIPYLLSITGDTSRSVISIGFSDQSIINLVTFWMPIPFIIAGIYLSYKRLSLNMFYFLIIGALVCLGLSVFMKVTFENSAKFTFILSYFYAVFFGLAIYNLLDLVTRPLLKRFLLAGIVFFLFTTPVITEAAYLVSPWFRDNMYKFSGRHIVFDKDKERNEAYAWIRNNTPPDALIILSYVETSNPDTIAQNSTYEPAALTERNLFVVKDWYTVSNPEYAERVKVRRRLFSHDYSGIKDYFRRLKRPLYLLVEDTLSQYCAREDIFDNFKYDPEIFELVFTNGRQYVYRIRT